MLNLTPAAKDLNSYTYLRKNYFPFLNAFSFFSFPLEIGFILFFQF